MAKLSLIVYVYETNGKINISRAASTVLSGKQASMQAWATIGPRAKRRLKNQQTKKRVKTKNT